MKKTLLTGILIILLFVGTVAAVSVDYAQKQAIPLSTAKDNANSAFLLYVAQGKLGYSTAIEKEVSLAQTPIIIYDRSGIVYSYLFDVINKEGTIVGQVNAAGNKLVGAQIVRIEKTPRSFDPDVVIPKVRELAEKSYAGAQIDYVVFIMDQDQKIAVMVILNDKTGSTHRLTYDVRTFQLRSDLITYPGLIDAATTSSIFVSMSNSAATRAIQTYDSKTKSISSVAPEMRRIVLGNYMITINNRISGVSRVKSVEKENILSEKKPALLQQGKIPTYTTTQSIKSPDGKTSFTSSIIGKSIPASRFYPV